MAKISNTISLGYDSSGAEISLPLSQLVRHLYVCGKTGSGKSKLLEHLIRQLVARWPETGMLILDPHAALFDATISWLASSGIDHAQVIPFDLRSDWVCSLNVLRPRPGQDPAPLIHAAVRAILHGWKQGDATETPRLAKWLMTLLTTLYSSHCTLLEALDLIRSREIRTAMARQVEDAMAKSVWMAASNLKETAFQEELESTMNRLGRFLATRVLRLAFSQNDVSLDMQAALAKGQIIVASLATEGSRIAEEDAAVVGSLLVNEVFAAAKHRGKREGYPHRQFTVIIDEFQEYVSPVIAQSLAQLRGMNVGFVTAHQSMQQLLDLGPMGRQVLNALIANTSTQVIFQSGHPADLDILTPWIFRNSVNADEVKFQPYSTKVMDHKLEYHQSFSQSTTEGVSESTTWSSTQSSAKSTGTSTSHSQSVGRSRGTQQARGLGESSSTSTGSGQSHAESQAQSRADGTTASRASERSRGQNTSESDQRSLDGEYDPLAKIIGPEPTDTFDAAYVDEEEKHRALQRSIAKGASSGESQGASESESSAQTHSESQANAIQKTQSQQESQTQGLTRSESQGENTSESIQASESTGITQSVTEGFSETTGGNLTHSHSTSEGVTSAPMLMPIMGQEAQAPIFRNVEEALFKLSQRISGLKDRQAIVRTSSTPPVEMTTAHVPPATLSAKGIKAWTRRRLKQLPFAMSQEQASQRLDERRKAFEAKYLGPGSTDEPTRASRRIRE